jgi:prepilin-type N-terminal cleavage/methylation domain-containing protein
MSRLAGSRGQRGISLVELLVAMSIMLVLATMIIATWVALTDAYSFSSRSDKQRDFARQAIERMAREIRDAQQPPGGASTAFAYAYPNEVRLYSTFNRADAADPASAPRLTRLIYRVTDAAYGVGAVYRELPGADGAFGGGDDVSRLLIDNVSNAGNGMDAFTYWSYDPASGDLVPSDGTTTLVDPSRIVEVGITLLVDLNPGKAPNYMDLSTTVQPRNVREF